MKAFLTFLLLLFFDLSLWAQQNQIDSVIVHRCKYNFNQISKSIDSLDSSDNLISQFYYSSDTAGGPNSKILYTYNTASKLLTRISYSKSDSVTWKKKQEENRGYDSNNNLISNRTYSFSSGSTIPTYGYGYMHAFDSLQRLIENVNLIFDNSTSSLINNSRSLSSYDSDNRLFQSTNQLYIDSSNVWLNVSRGTFSYDTSGKRTMVYYERWDTAGFYTHNSTMHYYYLPNDSLDFSSNVGYLGHDSTVTLNTYNSLGYLVLNEITRWVGATTYPVEKYVYQYDAENRITSEMNYTYFLMTWGGCCESTYSYDDQNRLIEYYSSALGDCGRGGKNGSFVYNANDILDSTYTCTWTMGSLTCSACAHEYYSLRKGVTTTPISNGFQLFPNPAKTEIGLQLASFENDTPYFIFDEIGKLVKTDLLKSYTTTIFIESLSDGIYFISIPSITSKPQRFIKL